MWTEFGNPMPWFKIHSLQLPKQNIQSQLFSWTERRTNIHLRSLISQPAIKQKYTFLSPQSRILEKVRDAASFSSVQHLEDSHKCCSLIPAEERLNCSFMYLQILLYHEVERFTHLIKYFSWTPVSQMLSFPFHSWALSPHPHLVSPLLSSLNYLYWSPGMVMFPNPVITFWPFYYSTFLKHLVGNFSPGFSISWASWLAMRLPPSFPSSNGRCVRQLLTWLPGTPTSWYSHPHERPSPWVCVEPTDLFLMNRICQKWWDVTFEIRLQNDSDFYFVIHSFPLACLLSWRQLLREPHYGEACLVRHWQSPRANRQRGTGAPYAMPQSKWILSTTAQATLESDPPPSWALRWDHSPENTIPEL